MRIFKLFIYILAIIILQSVFFARLNLWGVSPDLVFVSVVVFAVLNRVRRTVLFAGVASLLQDVLSFGIYIHTITNLLVCMIINFIGDEFEGNEFFFAAGAVVVFTPIVFLLQSSVMIMFFNRPFNLLPFLLEIVLLEVYNLLVFPIVFALLRKFSYER